MKNHHWMVDKTTKIGDSTSKHNWWFRIDKEKRFNIGVNQQNGAYNWIMRGLSWFTTRSGQVVYFMDRLAQLNKHIYIISNLANLAVLVGIYGNINMHQLLILPFTHTTELENILNGYDTQCAAGIFIIRDMGIHMTHGEAVFVEFPFEGFFGGNWGRHPISTAKPSNNNNVLYILW